MAKKLTIRPHLRAWRLAKGWKLVPLANELRTGHSSVIAWEQGKAGVDDATFAEIARIYGITPAELSGPPAEAEHARAVHRLIEASRKLDAQKIERLATLAEDLAGAPPPEK